MDENFVFPIFCIDDRITPDVFALICRFTSIAVLILLSLLTTGFAFCLLIIVGHARVNVFHKQIPHAIFRYHNVQKIIVLQVENFSPKIGNISSSTSNQAIFKIFEINSMKITLELTIKLLFTLSNECISVYVFLLNIFVFIRRHRVLHINWKSIHNKYKYT